MNKKTITILTTSMEPVFSTAAGYYYYTKKPEYKLHGVGIEKLSCDDSVVFSLRLKLNGNLVWTKTQTELFNLPTAVPSPDNRFRDKKVMPLLALLRDFGNVKSIEVIPCDAKPVTLSYADIKNSKDFYYLGQNYKNRTKLLKQVNRYDNLTIMRNVIDINIIK